MLADKIYETLTNADKDRKLPIGELLIRRSTALRDHKIALEAQYSAKNQFARFAGHITATVSGLRYDYYEGIILQHPDHVHIASGEFGSTTAEVEEALGIDE